MTACLPFSSSKPSKAGAPLLLAPMAGYSHAPFRLLCREAGSDLGFSEVVSAEGLVRRSPRTMHYLETVHGEEPVAAHMYGSEPDVLAGAAQVAASLGRFCSIDINCGCPARKIKGKGAGVALMRDPEKIRVLVSAVAEATPLPVTIKTRLGIHPDQANLSEVAEAAEAGGAAALYVHARFASMRHAGPADWVMLARVKKERGIPVIGNGGVNVAADALDLLASTGVDGIMVGRAAIGAPWIFEEIQCLFEGRSFHPPDDSALRHIIERHLLMLHDHHIAGRRMLKRRRGTPEQIACRAFRCHLIQYLRGRRGIRALAGGLERKESIKELMQEVDDVLRKTVPQE